MDSMDSNSKIGPECCEVVDGFIKQMPDVEDHNKNGGILECPILGYGNDGDRNNLRI